MSKKYKVIAGAVSGARNKVFYENDTVEESAFPDGHASKLVKAGFLEEIKGKDKDAKAKADADAKAKADADAKAKADSDAKAKADADELK